MRSAIPQSLRPAAIRIEGQAVLFAIVLAAVAFLVGYPILLIVLNSFQVSLPGEEIALGLGNWRLALSEPGIRASIYNTFTILVARTLISFPIAILIAWLIARTDMPGRTWLEFMFWILYFLPTLPVTLGWILVLDPDYGFLNGIWRTLFQTSKGPFNIYSFWGIVWAHLASTTIAVKVILLAPAFRNLDATFEEASWTCGASALKTLARIVVPVMTPAIMVVMTLAIIHGLQAFEIEMILGTPIGLYVYSTKIYSLIQQEPPLFGPATALSTTSLLMILPFIILQRWLIGRRQFTTLTGRYQSHLTRLGVWRYPAFTFVFLVTAVLTLVPLGFLLAGTFMKVFGFFHIKDPWTLANWSRVLNDPIFLRSVSNTIVLGAGASLLSLILFPMIAYFIVRSRFAARALLDFLSWLPIALPGILVGIGLLWAFLGSPIFRPFYGTLFLLVLATSITSMATSTNIIKSNILQIGSELEDASRVSGASSAQTYRRIVLPLIAPVLVLVAVMNFIHAAKDISSVALLATASSRTVSLLQLDYIVGGEHESASVVAVLVIALTTGIALLVRMFGLRPDKRE